MTAGLSFLGEPSSLVVWGFGVLSLLVPSDTKISGCRGFRYDRRGLRDDDSSIAR